MKNITAQNPQTPFDRAFVAAHPIKDAVREWRKIEKDLADGERATITFTRWDGKVAERRATREDAVLKLDIDRVKRIQKTLLDQTYGDTDPQVLKGIVGLILDSVQSAQKFESQAFVDALIAGVTHADAMSEDVEFSDGAGFTLPVMTSALYDLLFLRESKFVPDLHAIVDTLKRTRRYCHLVAEQASRLIEEHGRAAAEAQEAAAIEAKVTPEMRVAATESIAVPAVRSRPPTLAPIDAWCFYEKESDDAADEDASQEPDWN